VWRTDDVTPLSQHPNDPARDARMDTAVEFLTTFTVAIPDGIAAETVETVEAREAERAHDLAEQGHLLRLWKLPGTGRALGLWQAHDAAQLAAILASLPLDPWMTVETTPLSPHPNDPALAGADSSSPR
jgi:muconolactone delta-isomerase